jgi:hypothetical protein
MSQTTKNFSERDANQTLQASYNDVNATLGVDGFVVGKVGRAIEKVAASATIDDFNFYEGVALLYTIRITYSDNTKSDFTRVERTV